ncbi:MAG: M23 family metallopeptidase [Nevskiaceae bacterium]|nr:MAG: M23 family metallopeptidase [Nevskiaceae bacterium]
MSVLRALLLMAALTFAGGAAADGDDAKLPFTLQGDWRQGALLIGHTVPGNQVWFNGRALSVSPDGDFVFGLDRDEPAQAELKVQLPGAAPQVYRYAVEKRQYEIQNINGLPPKMVNPPPAVQQRIANDQRLAREARQHDSPRRDFLQRFIWPCAGPISGVYGSQRILNGEPKQPHYGVDVAVPVGTPVRAPAGGVISLAEKDMYFTGGTLMIDHGQGVASAFLHLSKLLVKVGDVVQQGQVIALSGKTGRATGPHLDWRMNWFESRIDAQQLAGAMTAKP